MDFKEIKQFVGMERLLAHYNVTISSHRRCACPLHNGSNKTSFSVASDDQAWTCFTECDCGGDIFTFVEKMENCDNAESRIKIEKMFGLGDDPKATIAKTHRQKAAKDISSQIEYQYKDKGGENVFSTLRIEFEDGTKTFRQKYNGTWKLPPEVRTLYNLDKIHGSVDEVIFLCEGEKAADAITSIGYVGTTNPLGSGNWEEKYAETLRNRNVVIMPDADEHGEKWRDAVIKTMMGVVESVRIINVPDEFIEENPKFKGHDIADMVQEMGRNDAWEFIEEQLGIVDVMPRGIDIEMIGRPSDIYERIQRNAARGLDTNVFNLNEWLPSLTINIKKGDLIVLMANTGTGKSRTLHNIPFHIRRLNYAIFDLELSIETLTLRYAAMENRVSFDTVERMINERKSIRPVTVDNVFIQKIGGLTVPKIIERVELLEKIMDKEIHCVCIDYIGLMGGSGSSYEKTSTNVEEFKAYLGQSGKVGILTTQVARPEDRNTGMFKCPSPFQSKNSGSMENSAQLLMGLWKDEHDRQRLYARIMKYSHGSYPTHDINLDANDLLITDASARAVHKKELDGIDYDREF